MRNLKKILALVLALVMSLSLMATAGAASFQDVKDDNPYKTAIDVLDELKVFQGFEDGTFKPDDTLTRAQAAVLVYRIATGDVDNKYLDNYTFMQQSKFTDLEGYNWAKGYINYCQNAGIVVGTDATHFNPGGQVTGYQLLVMLLRTLGYGKAGEFTDPKGWELQTASIAEREGITVNVTGGDFHSPAPRQMVAEILFQGLLTETVQYSALTPGGYTKGETLGLREFGLEGYEAVVVANEFANLNDTQVLAQGKTQVQVEGEDNVRTLNYGTKITDIGERRLIYTQNKARVLYLADEVDGEKLNATKEYGAGVELRTDVSNPLSAISSAKFEKAAEMDLTGSTEFYINFEPNGYYTSDYRIEYTIEFASDFDGYASEAAYNRAAGFTVGTTTNWVTNTKLSRIIPAGQPITLTDYNNMWEIFTRSNGLGNDTDEGTDNTTQQGVKRGKVFVATQTKEDISDKISFKAFEKDYLNPIVTSQNWNQSNNGEWVKFIDNNGDGDCEYAFKTQYTLDEAISSYKNKAGDTVIQYRGFDDDDHTDRPDDYTVRYMEDDEAVERDIAVGDIVLRARIDNQYLVSKAKSVTTSANSYNYKDDEIKAADGETYGQSGIGNATDMQIYIANMAPNTEYEMFLDKFGFVRAYRLPGGTQYALVTELYYTNGQYGNIEQNWPMTAELTMPDADGNPVTKEYSVAAGGASQLTAKQPWALVNSRASTGNYYNWLQPAIAHLGVTRTTPIDYSPTKGTPDFATINPLYSTYWPSALQLVRNIDDWNGVNEFNYGAQNYKQVNVADPEWNEAQDGTSSFTNIAIVNGDDTVTLTGAAKLNLRTTGDIDPVHPYAVDYIQLSKANPGAKAASYVIDDGNDLNDTYEENNNWYVNADKNTQFYIVYDKGVKYFTSYENMPDLKSDLVGNIHAAYAVARNTTTGTSTKNYWMADVIVYEVQKWDDKSAASISLAYFTASQQLQSSSSVTINTLNSKTSPAKVDLTPAGLSWGTSNNWWDNWGTSWQGYGFYQLYNETLPAEGETVMSAKSIEAIDDEFAKYGIYAGTVTQEIDTATKGDYIPVNIDRNDKVTVNGDPDVLATNIRLSISDSKVYSITGAVRSNPTDYRYYAEADNLVYNNVRWSDVKAGDRIIWVGECKDGKLSVSGSSFIVDLGNDTPNNNPLLDNYELWLATPWWLGGGNTVGQGLTPVIAVDGDNLWDAILDEQEDKTPTSYTVKVTTALKDGATPAETIDGVEFTVTPDTFTAEQIKNGKTFTISANAPYDITGDVKITNKGKDGAGENAVIVDNNDGTYTFYQITGNIELSAEVSKVEKTLAVTLTDSGLSNVNLVYGDPAQTEATWDGTSKTMDKGTAYTISFTPAAGVTYAVDGEEKAPETEGDNAGKIVITGTLDDNTAIVITKVVYDLAVTDNASVGSNFTLKYDTTTNASWDGTAEELNKDTAYTISFTPAPGYDYTVDGDPVTAEAEGDNAGKIVILGTMDAAKTYVVARTAKQVTITVTGDNVVPQEIKVDAGTQLNQVGTNGVITVTASAPVAKYELPSTITVEIGDTEVIASAYTWTKTQGTVSFAGLANTVLLEEDMTITVDATVVTFTVGTLANLTIEPSGGTVEYGGSLTVTPAGALITSGVQYSLDGGNTWVDIEINPLTGKGTIENITANITFQATP